MEETAAAVDGGGMAGLSLESGPWLVVVVVYASASSCLSLLNWLCLAVYLILTYRKSTTSKYSCACFAAYYTICSHSCDQAGVILYASAIRILYRLRPSLGSLVMSVIEVD